jgi:hypothetical protein
MALKVMCCIEDKGHAVPDERYYNAVGRQDIFT